MPIRRTNRLNQKEWLKKNQHLKILDLGCSPASYWKEANHFADIKDHTEDFNKLSAVTSAHSHEDILNCNIVKIKIDFITFLNNVEIVSNEGVTNKNVNEKGENMKNDPKCLLVIKKNEKISRNDKCPSTGKKYKHCCGAL